MTRSDVDAADDDAILPRDNPLDLAAFALLFAGDHHDGIPALQFETHNLEHLRGERDDPGITLLPELAGDGTEDTRPAGGAIGVDDHTCVLAKADVRPVVAACLFLGPHDHGPDHVALLDGAARRGLLDGGNDHVPNPGVAPLAPAEHANGQDTPGPRVVRDPEPRLLLYHYSALDMMLASRHLLRAESGLVSTIRTVSPTRASLPSSCTMNFLERRTRFLYIGWRTRASTETVTVLSALSATMIPTRSLRLLRPVSVWICPSSWPAPGPWQDLHRGRPRPPRRGPVASRPRAPRPSQESGFSLPLPLPTLPFSGSGPSGSWRCSS